jgi:hypothetical protein
MPLLADSWESLIAFLVILLLSGLSNWLQRRKGRPPEPAEGEEAELPPPLRPLRRTRETGEPTPEPTPPEPTFELERELRRLFGEESSPPPPPPEPAAAPPVLPAPASPTLSESLEARPAPTRELATLAQAEEAYQRASALDELAQAKLEAARARAEAAKALAARRRAEAVARLQGRSPEVEALLTALRSPQTARQALLATFIFGPPKALDEPFPAIPGLRR